MSQPVRLPLLSGSRSEKATSRALEPALANHGNRLEAAIGVHRLGAGRKRHLAARRSEFLLGEGIAPDAVLALERHERSTLLGITVDERHAFRVAILIIGERLAVLAEQRPEHGIAQAFEHPPVIVEGCSEPGAGIRYGKERRSGGIEHHLRIAAEEARIGEEIETATIDELAKLLLVGMLAIEVDGNGGDLDRHRPVRCGRRLVGEGREDDEARGARNERRSEIVRGSARQGPHAN